MRKQFRRIPLALTVIFAAAGMFSAGLALGQTKFGEPKSIIHAVSIQWKPGTPDTEKQKVLEGVREMASEVPGVKNVWIKSDRVEPRGYDDGFAIEFRDRAAADAYALSEAHKQWNQRYTAIRAASVSIDVTNP